MILNYLEYSLDELIDTLDAMDEEAFPERAAKLRQELAGRELISPSNDEELDENFDYNEQFYACPSCECKIGIFSKTLNKWGKNKECPHCGEPFAIITNVKSLTYIFIFGTLFHFFFLRPLIVGFGASSYISIAIVVAFIVFLSKRLKKVRRSNVN